MFMLVYMYTIHDIILLNRQKCYRVNFSVDVVRMKSVTHLREATDARPSRANNVGMKY